MPHCNNDFSVSDLEQALDRLKSGKAPGMDGIVKEHIIFSHPAMYNCVSYLSV